MPNTFDQHLGPMMAEANNLALEENLRHRRGSQVLGLAYQNAQRPAYSDQMVNREYGNAAEQAALQRNTSMGSLRSSLGLSGLSGGSGIAAAAGAQIEGQYLGDLQASRRTLIQRQAETNAQQRMGLLGQAQGVADYEARPPSVIGLDARQDAIGALLTKEGIDAQERASRQTSKDNKRAGTLGLIGSIGGALLGLI